MKVTMLVTTPQEVEIEFPFFFKNVGYYAMLSENKAISIYDTITLFNHASSIAPNIDGSHEVITAEEFTRVYDSKIEVLQSFKSQFFTK
jgi:hypothetical protein